MSSEIAVRDTITGDKDATEVVSNCYIGYSEYVARTRAYAGIIDGMKVVHRRVVYAAKNYSKKVKSAVIVGDSMKYHPHGDVSIYDVLVEMTCKFGRFPLFDGTGNFGGLGEGSAAMRYTEATLSDIGRLMCLDLIDYADYMDGEAGLPEPKYLPSLIPYSLLTGYTSIPVGLPNPNVPSYNAMDLVNYYIDYLEGRTPNLPIPDFGNVILDDTRENINNLTRTGYGKLWFRPNIIQEDYNKLVLTEETPKCSFWKVVNKLNDWISQGLVDYIDETDGNGPRHVFIVNNTSKLDPKVVKDRIDRTMRCSLTYNFIFEYENHVYYCGFDYIVKKNIEYLKKCTIRKYTDYYNKANAKMEVFRAIEDYKKSGELKHIDEMTDNEVIDVIVGLGYSKDVARKVLDKSTRYLTKSHQNEIDDLQKEIDEYRSYIDNPDGYILGLYHKLKDLIIPFYNSREHTKILGEIDTRSKYASLNEEGDRIIISTDSDKGVQWNHKVFLVSGNGHCAFKLISASNNAEIDLSDDYTKYKYISSDKGKYLVLFFYGCIIVKRITDIWEGFDCKLWDGWNCTGVLTISTDKIEVTDERNNKSIVTLPDQIKRRRVVYPTSVIKYTIKEVKEISEDGGSEVQVYRL